MKRDIQILALSFFTCGASALGADQLLPVRDVEKSLRTNQFVLMQPSVVTDLPETPPAWSKVTLDQTSIHLPLQQIGSITNRGSLIIRFSGENGLEILLTQIAQPPVVSFSQARAIEMVTVADLDKASAEDRDEVLMMLKGKATKPEGTYQTHIVDTSTLRAVVIESLMRVEEESVRITACDVYSQSNNVGFLLVIRNEPDELFSFRVLNGISFTGMAMRSARVLADLEVIRKQLAGTQTP